MACFALTRPEMVGCVSNSPGMPDLTFESLPIIASRWKMTTKWAHIYSTFQMCGAWLLGRQGPWPGAHHHPREGHVYWHPFQGRNPFNTIFKLPSIHGDRLIKEPLIRKIYMNMQQQAPYFVEAIDREVLPMDTSNFTCYCKTWVFHVEEIFASFAVDQETLQIYHSWLGLLYNVSKMCKNFLPQKFKIEKLQNLTATNISCFTVLPCQKHHVYMCV